MKILFPFVGDHIGGSHIATCLLIKQLIKHNIIPIVVLHQKGPLETYLKDNNISYAVITQGRIVTPSFIPLQIFNMVKNTKTLAEILKKEQIDIVHTNDLRMHYSWLFAARCSKNTKHIWHQHSQTSSWRLNFFSYFTNTVLTISKYCKSVFPAFFRKKAEVIYNPFDTENISKHTPHNLHHELSIDKNTKIIGFIGNFTKQKRPDFFVEISKRINQIHPNYHFVMIGEQRSPLHEEILKAIQDNQLTDRIHLLGSRFPVEPYIKSMNVIIAPATNEGLGRILIESMLCNTPIIASNHGGHKEIIKHEETGFLIQPDDAQRFAEKATQLLKNETLKEQITNTAHQYASKNFSLDLYVKTILDNYKKLSQED